MGTINGIETAAQVRKADSKCNIILFTSSYDHMLDGYDVRALGYVLKPLTEHKNSLYKH